MFHYIYVHSPTVLAFILLACSIILTGINRITNKYKIEQIIIKLCIVAYIGIIIYGTLLSREKSETSKGFSLIPFATYHLARTQNKEYYRVAFMNIALFFPLGCLMNCLNLGGKKKWLYPILTGLILSSSIEIVQFIFNLGYLETDDIIHNTLGVILGVLICSSINYMIDETIGILKQPPLDDTD